MNYHRIFKKRLDCDKIFIFITLVLISKLSMKIKRLSTEVKAHLKEHSI